MIKQNSVFATFAACAIACLGLTTSQESPAQTATGQPVRVGAIFTMTGPLGPQGQGQKHGAELALKVINESGGVGGRPLEFVFVDDSFNPDVAISKANDLIHSGNVVSLISHSTVATAAIGGITQPMGMPLLAISGLNPAVEKDRTCVFHIFAPQELNARALLSYAKAQGYTRLALLHDSGYGAVLAKLIQPLLGEYGVELVATEKFDASAMDATAQAAKVKAADPQAYLVIAANPTPFRNLRQLRATQPIIAAIGTSTYESVKGMGVGADNIVFADFMVAEDPLPFQKDFVERYKKEYGALPKNYEAAGWDLVNIIADAIKTAGPNASPADLCKAVHNEVYHGAMVETRDLSAPDMTGIKVSDFVFSKVDNGTYSRLPFRVKD